MSVQYIFIYCSQEGKYRGVKQRQAKELNRLERTHLETNNYVIDLETMIGKREFENST